MKFILKCDYCGQVLSPGSNSHYCATTVSDYVSFDFCRLACLFSHPIARHTRVARRLRHQQLEKQERDLRRRCQDQRERRASE